MRDGEISEKELQGFTPVVRVSGKFLETLMCAGVSLDAWIDRQYGLAPDDYQLVSSEKSQEPMLYVRDSIQDSTRLEDLTESEMPEELKGSGYAGPAPEGDPASFKYSLWRGYDASNPHNLF